MERKIAATVFARAIGLYLRHARHRVLAVTLQGVIMAYVVSPEAYARMLQGKKLSHDE